MSSGGRDSFAKLVMEIGNQSKFYGLYQSTEHFGFIWWGIYSVLTLKLEIVEYDLSK